MPMAILEGREEGAAWCLYLHGHGHVEQDRHDHAGCGRVAGHLVYNN